MRIVAGWAFVDGELRADVALEIDDRGRLASVTFEAAPTASDLHWPNKLVLPGFIDAMAVMTPARLRSAVTAAGVSEDIAAASNFFDPVALKVAATACFRQLLDQGTTGLAWLQPAVASIPLQVSLADAVCDAAQAVGIRLLFLQALDTRGQVGRADAALSFEPAVEALLTIGQHVALRRDPKIGWGVGALHLEDASVDEWVALKTRFAHVPMLLPTEASRGWLSVGTPLHARTPLELLLQSNLIDSCTSVIDPWAMTEPERMLLLVFGANVVARGDRLAFEGSLRHLLRHRVPIAIGSGEAASVAGLAMRLSKGFTEQPSAPLRRANLALLVDAMTTQSGRACGMGAGSLVPGAWADLAAYELLTPDLVVESAEATLAAVLTTSAWRPTELYVAGKPVYGLKTAS